ncbi:MAG: 23S rRNA (adenine(2503)-C(2))-methyltransferase RlmN [Ignavibacteriaceae bacterium]|nr:23S rRNA (adenine(2503)-C(2))-methyltransferase RlmN [Ignavibacteriaceae bacterium]
MTTTETAVSKKEQLKGKTLSELKEWFLANSEPSFRGEQVFNWMYNHLAEDYSEMLNISKDLRKKLDEKTILNTLRITDKKVSSSEGTVKLLLKTAQDNLIECVIIPEEKRCTLCISSQVGCPLDCKFCATGIMGYKRNLTPGEIFDQYAIAQRNYDRAISNIVYMGMGEPLLNFKNTVKSLEIFAEELTTGISLKKVTVSTAGIAPKIKELADTGLKPKLALSLHSCFEEIRSKIMPINDKYSLSETIKSVFYYAEKTGTRITFEYVMLKDINDRIEDADALVKLCRRIPSKVNIIPFNSLQHINPKGISAELIPTSKKEIEKFANYLRDKNITVMVRDTQGSDIAAACGQLAITQTA